MDYRALVYERYTSQKIPARQHATEALRERWSRPAARRLSGWLPDDRSAAVLDLACGSGNVLHLLRSLGYRDVTGVDVSPEQVEVARRVGFPVVRANVLEFLRGRSEDADCIFAFDLVEHFTKAELFEFLASCLRALRPGGALILQTPNAESPWGAMHRYHDITHELGLDPAALEHVLTVTGFEAFRARECGPVVHGVPSLLRWGAWRLLHAGLVAWNLAEMGERGSGVYTRVFLARALKPRVR